MFTHLLDSHGATVFERDLPANPDAFPNAILHVARRGSWDAMFPIPLKGKRSIAVVAREHASA